MMMIGVSSMSTEKRGKVWINPKKIVAQVLCVWKRNYQWRRLCVGEKECMLARECVCQRLWGRKRVWEEVEEGDERDHPLTQYATHHCVYIFPSLLLLPSREGHRCFKCSTLDSCVVQNCHEIFVEVPLQVFTGIERTRVTPTNWSLQKIWINFFR